MIREGKAGGGGGTGWVGVEGGGKALTSLYVRLIPLRRGCWGGVCSAKLMLLWLEWRVAMEEDEP